MRLLALGLMFPLGCAAADVVTGTVGAPGGTLAYERGFLFNAAHAHVPGLQAVAGATVELTQGAKVLASGKTNARGVYTFHAPAGFEPHPRYRVRATSGGQHLEAFVTALRTNIDPATDALAKLVAQHANLARLRNADVQQLMPLIQHLAWEVDMPAAQSGTALAAMLRAAATNDEEVFNIIASIGAPGEMRGTVTDAAKKPLERVTILVRERTTGVTQAMAHTDAKGSYRVRVRPGEYTAVALNETAGSMAASELSASRVAVTAAGLARHFQLGPGGRVSGLVASHNGARLANVRVKLFSKGALLFQVRTQDDGSYRFNVAPGAYVLLAENATLQPFASNLPGVPVEIRAGAAVTADLKLADGQMIGGKAGPGTNVRIVDAQTRGPVHAVRTNRAGEYRLWLKPGRYAVQ